MTIPWSVGCGALTAHSAAWQVAAAPNPRPPGARPPAPGAAPPREANASLVRPAVATH